MRALWAVAVAVGVAVGLETVRPGLPAVPVTVPVIVRFAALVGAVVALV